MKTERFRWLAAVMAAQPGGELVGRTRLQKTMRLLQRLGLPSDYVFRMHHYGPYSDGIQSDINLLERMKFVSEEERLTQDGRLYSVFTARPDAKIEAVARFGLAIDRMAREDDAVVLELAATYDYFREKGNDHARSIALLRRMKGDKCTPSKVDKARRLLKDIGLSSE